MSSGERKRSLQLIRSPQRIPIEDQPIHEPSVQGALFPLPKRDLLIFLVFPRVTEAEFTKTLELARPVTILELRRSPRFDIGSLNRQEAFRFFEELHTKYYDLSSGQGFESGPPDPVSLVDTFLSRAPNRLEGPVLLLVSDTTIENRTSEVSVPSRIACLFATASKHPWQVLEIPSFA